MNHSWNNSADKIHRQVMWNRLIAVVEEQAQALLSTAFGAVTREAGDLSAGVYDTQGRMLAQAVTGTPGHVNTMAAAVTHFLERFPPETLAPGDVLVTNDPWMGTGHLYDFVVVTPAFYNGTLVAFFASTCHVIDIGGRGFTAEARSLFEEGVQFPHLKLFQAGSINDTFFSILEANTRNPIETRGDLLSLVSCNEAGCQRLYAMMDEFSLECIDELAAYILEHSRNAMLAAIEKVPAGEYAYRMELDGMESGVEINCTMQVNADKITLDFSGSSPASRFGINSPKCYTDAYSLFGLKCIIAPDVPNNAGSLGVFEVTAEPGSIVNPQRPSPVTARHVIGQMLADVVFGCLEQALPGQVPAEGAGSIWVLAMSSAHDYVSEAELGGASRFNVMSIGIGGMGAQPGRDGHSATAFPSGVGAIPVEVTENDCPLVFWRRELLPESAGAGKYYGGSGQIIEIANREQKPFTLSAATFDRMRNPARGRQGGADGKVGSARLTGGETITDKGVHVIPGHERLIIELPGGGGLGVPDKRSS